MNALCLQVSMVKQRHTYLYLEHCMVMEKIQVPSSEFSCNTAGLNSCVTTYCGSQLVLNFNNQYRLTFPSLMAPGLCRSCRSGIVCKASLCPPVSKRRCWSKLINYSSTFSVQICILSTLFVSTRIGTHRAGLYNRSFLLVPDLYQG
jgi:hypothetical protein